MAISSSRSSMHLTSVLRPTPRGSKPTRSNRPRNAGSANQCPIHSSISMPDPPGPPGLRTNIPIRGSTAARILATATSMVGPLGEAWSIGTTSVAHSWPPHSSHSSGAGSNGSRRVSPVRLMEPTPSSTRQAPPTATSRRTTTTNRRITRGLIRPELPRSSRPSLPEAMPRLLQRLR